MTFLTKMENTYLAILRVTILLIASLTLLAAILMTVTSLPAFLNAPKKEDILINNSEYPKLDGYLQEKQATVSSENNSGTSSATTDSSNNAETNQNASKKEAAKALRSYMIAVANNGATEDWIQEHILSKLENDIDEKYRDSYYQSMIAVFSDLMKKSKEQKIIFERYQDFNAANEDKDFIDIDAVINWHHQKFIANINAKQTEQELSIAEAESKKTEAKSSVLFAAGFFATFVFFVFLFIIIKIERNLRVIADRPVGSSSNP